MATVDFSLPGSLNFITPWLNALGVPLLAVGVSVMIWAYRRLAKLYEKQVEVLEGLTGRQIKLMEDFSGKQIKSIEEVHTKQTTLMDEFRGKQITSIG